MFEIKDEGWRKRNTRVVLLCEECKHSYVDVHDYTAVNAGMKHVHEPRYKCNLTGDVVPVDGFCHRAEYRKENYKYIQKRHKGGEQE